MQAKDIPDSAIYDLIASGTTSLYGIRDALRPAYPPKIVRAKLAQMVNKGRLHGCACGCRGDFACPPLTRAPLPSHNGIAG